MSSNEDLQVLSLNCWGLAFISKYRKLRLQAIAHSLSSCSYDIITLQEVWVQEDYQYILDKVKHTLPYAKYFYSGALGSGLAILSRYPIISTAYHRYALNGKPLKLLHSDYYVGKGCGTAVVKHPALGYLEIFNTHLHAGYGPKDQYKAHRASECWQLAYLLRHSAAMGRHIIMSGDFNSVPTSFNYKLIHQHGFMSDSWFQVHGEPDIDKFDMDNMTPESYTQFFGFTCNSPFNTFSRYYSPCNNDNAKKLLGKRLDYIFYRQTPQLTCIDSQVVFTDLVQGEMSYSDHFGVVSIFKVTSPESSEWKKHMDPLQIQLCDPSFTRLQSNTICDILQALKLDKVKAKKDAHWLLRLLAVGVLVQLCLFVAVVAVPTLLPQSLVIILVIVFGNTLMNLVSFALPVCLIVGFVFGSTEQRALTQFIEEIETFQAQQQKEEENYLISIP
ncbi:Endonuclease/exonuclease/phosphatase [Helicostylum pulchrum]|nr:Endonuclease/exonuclease/phosphatase [Helicostylum pulchrum]